MGFRDTPKNRRRWPNSNPVLSRRLLFSERRTWAAGIGVSRFLKSFAVSEASCKMTNVGGKPPVRLCLAESHKGDVLNTSRNKSLQTKVEKTTDTVAFTTTLGKYTLLCSIRRHKKNPESFEQVSRRQQCSTCQHSEDVLSNM